MIKIVSENNKMYILKILDVVKHTNGQIGIVMNINTSFNDLKVCIINPKTSANNVYGNWELSSVERFVGEIVIKQE